MSGILEQNGRLSRSVLLADIPRIMEALNLQTHTREPGSLQNLMDRRSFSQSFEDVDEEHWTSHSVNQSIEDRVLTPRFGNLENSQHVQLDNPSPDEIIIRQRGRKKFPKLNWSPVKSPFKTPTKKTTTSHHLSLLSPSPAKSLFNNSSPMILRSSPRKRIFNDNSADEQNSSTPCTTPNKRLKFDEKSLNSTNSGLPMKTLLKGLSNSQLIDIICEMSRKEPGIKDEILKNLPIADVRPMEEHLVVLRKNINKSSPRSRLLSKTDGSAYTRASIHLTSFKKAICLHCKTLTESQHWDALIDYVLMAWSYVRALPLWDEISHNNLRRDCFKILTLNVKNALRTAGNDLGNERLTNVNNKLKSMITDYEDANKCQEYLDILVPSKN
ncbi:unnamed protein product [Diamesa serratosioi]